MARAKRARPRPRPSGGSDLKALELIRKSGILNRHATLDQIMALSTTLAGPGFGDDAAASWTFISPHYVYKGDQKV